ncbi:MAG: HlyD family efflux transporter periplasmic adaptor subunit [Chthoniobacter sp.]
MLAAGGKVVTLIDITDVYMTFFLPTAEAGQLLYGGDARIVLDVLPGRPIPATVSFVSPTAQFTPKEVETRSEREKLMFRIKVKIAPALLLRYVDRVKTGLPGIAYVKLTPETAWPPQLQTDLPTSTPAR